MKSTAMIFAVAVSAVASTGCAPGSTGPSPVGLGEPALNNTLSVTIENGRATSMRIFATRDNMKFLVGEVGPRETARFRMPRMIFSGRGDLRLVADPWGSTLEQESEPIVLTWGSEVEWRLRAGGSARVWVR